MHITLGFLPLTEKRETNLPFSSMIAVSTRKGGNGLKVNIEIAPQYKEPYAVIYASMVTEEVQHVINLLHEKDSPITARLEDKIVILQPSEVYMVRIENGDTVIYSESHRYYSRKRLYELADQLGNQFMQISKSTLVNLAYLENVEAGFSGTLLLKLKNGCKDYVSRKYLPEFKKYLGI